MRISPIQKTPKAAETLRYIWKTPTGHPDPQSPQIPPATKKEMPKTPENFENI